MGWESKHFEYMQYQIDQSKSQIQSKDQHIGLKTSNHLRLKLRPNSSLKYINEREMELRILNLDLEGKYAQATDMVVGLKGALALAHKKNDEVNAEIRRLRQQRDKAQKALTRQEKHLAFL